MKRIFYLNNWFLWGIYVNITVLDTCQSCFIPHLIKKPQKFPGCLSLETHLNYTLTSE